MKLFLIKDTPMKILLEDYSFRFNNETLTIEKWFAFDWVSVPQIFCWIFKLNNTNTLIYWMEHDYLYSKLCSKSLNRREADLHYMSRLNPLGTKLLAYAGVRLWGWLSFKKDTNYNKYRTTIKEYITLLKI